MKQRCALIIVLIFSLGMILVSNSTLSIDDQDVNQIVTKKYFESYTSHSAIWIQSDQEFADQAAAESWEGNGTKNFPYIITGYYFNQETQPLRIWHTSVHWMFINNVVDGVGDDIQCGTWIEDAPNGAIINCEFLNRHSGMVLISPENITVSGNYVHDATANGIDVLGASTNCNYSDNNVEDVNGHGIVVQGLIYSEISGNEISECGGFGIRIQNVFSNSIVTRNEISDTYGGGISFALAFNSEISFNTISVVEEVGIEGFGVNLSNVKNNSISNVTEDGVGISVDYCQFSEISFNDLQNGTGPGIEFLGGSNSTIKWNMISNFDLYGIWLDEGSEFVDVKYNVFLNNGNDCQCYDDGESNLFEFNFYDDWLSPDANNDKIVDVPYEIDGISENSDRFPVTEMGYIPPASPTSTITTSSSEFPDMTITLIIVGGAAGTIVLIAGILVLKRR